MLNSGDGDLDPVGGAGSLAPGLRAGSMVTPPGTAVELRAAGTGVTKRTLGPGRGAVPGGGPGGSGESSELLDNTVGLDRALGDSSPPFLGNRFGILYAHIELPDAPETH
ncbi:hypothetical protein EKO27_g4965 [Xylaria grammica]|uniref:Uncharacterized protein n=1 Tax=Xylaria grammica TaxID=363999 RepID=A0A439D6W8_9PEZI|nr:hypothetical protein EKO27_g4965 [Xylaria grammica]